MTANTIIRDRLIRHAVQIERFKSGLVTRYITQLNQSERGLEERLRRELAKRGDLSRSSQRIDRLIKDMREIRRIGWMQANGTLRGELGNLAVQEGKWISTAMDEAVGLAHFETVLPAPQLLRAVVTSRPFQGRFLREWFSGLERAEASQVSAVVRQGVLEGAGIDDMVRQLRGTSANKFADGVLQISRHNAESVVRTAVAHTTNAARDKVYNANKDVLEGVQWVSTLDGRTTPICQDRDGRVDPNPGAKIPDDAPLLVPAGARPPAHMRCRSIMAPWFNSAAILGSRPFVNSTKTRAGREIDFRAQAKSKAGESWKGMSRKDRGALVKQKRDAWGEKNIGTLPSKTTYPEFLKRQSAKFQDDVLGPTRGKLFRKGVGVDKFVDKSGRQFTLKELEVAGLL